MNRARFTEFMQTPSALSPESSALLAEVVKDFPYCQTAHLLYVKSLHLQNSIHYNTQLKIAAAYTTDRSVLHALITRTSPSSPLQAVSRNDEQIVHTLRSDTVPAPPEPVAAKTDPAPLEILEARLKELEELNRKAESELQHRNELLAGEAEARLIAEKQEADKTEAEAPAVNKNDSLPSRKSAPVPEPDNLVEPVNTDDTLKTVRDLETLADTYISAAIDATIQIELDRDEPELPVSESHEEEGADALQEQSEMTFSDWLKKSRKEKVKNPVQEPEGQEEEKKHKETELIERFIKEEPRITKPKKEFYSPVNMARQSVVEDLSFVTETLAGIYAKQGNVAKAIRSYQTLSLKYPEKKLYFASLIEKLEQGL